MKILNSLNKNRNILNFTHNNLNITFNPEINTAWYYMLPQCYTRELLKDIKKFQHQLISFNEKNNGAIKYVVLTSENNNVFSFGGELNFFVDCILNNKKDDLFLYAKSCIDVMYKNLIGINGDITTISLVKGQALGGGFESALANQIFVAEENSVFAFPEIRFNMFPGMGAFSILSRKIGSSKAEKMILSGKFYNATELFKIGLIDVIAERGKGEQEVTKLIKKYSNYSSGHKYFQKAKKYTNPVTYEELSEIINIWVEAALKLKERDLKMMRKLSQRQNRLNL